MFTTVASGVAMAALGLLLGGAYFGGLYLTVLRLKSSRRPELLLIGSFLGRIGVVAVILWAVLVGGAWQHVVVMTGGFILARIILTRRLGLPSREADTPRRL